MTDHETTTEAEARRVLFEFYAPNDSERWDGFEKRMDAYAEAVRAAERARLIGDVDIERASDRREYLLRHAVPCVIVDSFWGDFAEMVGKEVEARWRELFAKRGLTEDTAR